MQNTSSDTDSMPAQQHNSPPHNNSTQDLEPENRSIHLQHTIKDTLVAHDWFKQLVRAPDIKIPFIFSIVHCGYCSERYWNSEIWEDWRSCSFPFINCLLMWQNTSKCWVLLTSIRSTAKEKQLESLKPLFLLKKEKLREAVWWESRCCPLVTAVPSIVFSLCHYLNTSFNIKILSNCFLIQGPLH